MVWRLWHTVFVCVGAFWAAAAHADASEVPPAPSRESVSSTIVLVLPDGDPTTDRLGYRSLLGQLKELSIGVVVERLQLGLPFFERMRRAEQLARHHGATAVVWFDHESETKFRVLVYETASRSHVGRELRHAPGSVAAAEELAVVLRSALESLLTGTPVAMDTVATAPEPKTSPVEPFGAPPSSFKPEEAKDAGDSLSRHPSFLWAGHVAYVGSLVGDEAVSVPWQHGVEIGLRRELSSWLYLVGQYLVLQTYRLELEQVEATVERHPGELAFGWHFGVERFDLSAEIGMQADYVARRTLVHDPGFRATPPDTRWRFALSPRLRASYLLVEHIDAFIGFGLELPLSRYSYVLRAPQGEVQLTQKIIRPRLGAGFLVHF